MNKSNVIIFLVGLGIGGTAAWYYSKKYYEKISQDEIDSVKAAYAEKYINEKHEFETEVDEKKETAKKAIEKPDLTSYTEVLKENKYVDYSKSKPVEEDIPEEIEGPYVIDPFDFGRIDYDQYNFVQYADGVIADDADEIVNDIELLVGPNFEEHFGEYEEDSVYFRNDETKCEYEIVKDAHTYEQIVGPITREE